MANLDDLLAAHVESPPYKSSLHSFVIEKSKEFLQLAADEKDRGSLKTTLMDRPGEHLPAPSGPDKKFLKYDLSPDDLRNLLGTSGWLTIGCDLEERPEEEFQELVHPCVTSPNNVPTSGNGGAYGLGEILVHPRLVALPWNVNVLPMPSKVPTR